MNTPREHGITPEAQSLFEGLQDFLRISAELTRQQLSCWNLQKFTTETPESLLTTIDDGITEQIRLNTTITKDVANELSTRHSVVLALRDGSHRHEISAIGYAPQILSYYAAVKHRQPQPETSQPYTLFSLRPESLACYHLLGPVWRYGNPPIDLSRVRSVRASGLFVPSPAGFIAQRVT